MKTYDYVVISGTSGCGKTTIKNLLLNRYNLKFSVSHTTRQKRMDEEEGVDYFFITKEKFTKMIQENKFLEYNYYNSNYYGVSLESLSKNTIFDVDVNGVESFKKAKLNALYVFIYSSKQTLQKRLTGRYKKANFSSEKIKEIVKNRTQSFDSDLEYSKGNNYDLIVENEDLKVAKWQLYDFFDNIYKNINF